MEKVLNVPMNEKEKELLRFVCDKLGVSMSNFVKMHSMKEARSLYEQFNKPAQESFKTGDQYHGQ